MYMIDGLRRQGPLRVLDQQQLEDAACLDVVREALQRFRTT